MDDDVVDAMKNEIGDLLKDFENDCPALDVNFPVSFTPYATSIEYLMSEHANLLPTRCRQTLEEDYSQSNVDYALDTDL